MKQVEHDLEALIRTFKVGVDDPRARDVRLSQHERAAVLAALRAALEMERLG